jgi:hypothetical protein
MTRPQIAHVVHAAHRQLKRDLTIDVELNSLDQLLDASGRHGSGVDSLVAILDSSLRLPATLVVRIALPGEGGVHEPDVGAFRDHCRDKANDAWLEAMILRQGGIRELPRALGLSLIAAALGVVAGYFAQGTDSTLLMVLLYAVAFISVIAAWTIGWTPIEQALFDWRAPAHTGSAYELLSRARVEVVERPREPGASPSVIAQG